MAGGPILSGRQHPLSLSLVPPTSSPSPSPMDMSDVAVRHTLAPLNIEVVHRIESSPAVVSLFREVRICVIVLVAGWVATSIVSSVSNRKKKDSS